MNLGNRYPQPKQIKIKNSKLVQYYKSRFPYCEACKALGAVTNRIHTLELHHIHGGNNRSDEMRNIIHLCHEHHERATTHNLKYGSGSRGWNHKYLAIKCQRGDVSYSDLEEWNCITEVMDCIIEIYKHESDKIIKYMSMIENFGAG